MANLRRLRNLTPGLSVGAATGALALVFVLTVVASQAGQAQTYSVIHSFAGGSDGARPLAGVTIDKGGNLYGTAFYGGIGYGTVYQLKNKGSGWVFNPLYNFASGTDGAHSLARVIFGPDGVLYGTTSEGGGGYGTVFKLRPAVTVCLSVACPWTETVLYNFLNGADGAYPGYGDLIFDQAGNIYGTTQHGGGRGCARYGCGTAFEMSPLGGGWTESVLSRFSKDGLLPTNGVIFDNASNLYGTTSSGGSSNAGTVFQLTPKGSGWKENTLYNFQGGSDGRNPYDSLILDHSGNLYGTTHSGGSGGGGTVFELSPSNGGWTYSLLYSITGGDNCGPWDSLVMDGAGNLYGTTVCDGANHAGSVFKLTPTPAPPWTYTSLYDFTGGNDGGYPYCNVIFDASGNLYGTTEYGGTETCNVGGISGCGVVWEITPVASSQ